MEYFARGVVWVCRHSWVKRGENSVVTFDLKDRQADAVPSERS